MRRSSSIGVSGPAWAGVSGAVGEGADRSGAGCAGQIRGPVERARPCQGPWPGVLSSGDSGLGTEGVGLKIGSQNRTPPLPESGQNGPRQANVPACQGADLRVYVELRGFEPLTPSMRTEYSGKQTCWLRAFLHVKALSTATITAPDRV
jgi:hypothetical protein